MKQRAIKFIKPTAIVLAIGFIYYLFVKITGLGLFCPFNKFLHIYCPGCGVSRMVIHLIHFEFYEAFSSNCAVFCMLPVFAAGFIRHSYLYIRYGKKGFGKAENILCWVLVGMLIVFTVLRNIFPIDILVP